ncbi:MAG: septation protein A [Pseudomonadota bacterium]
MADNAAGEAKGGSLLKLALELGPLGTFFLVNSRAEAWDLGRFLPIEGIAPDQMAIMVATAAFMVATVISLTISLAVFRRVPVMPMVSGVIVIVFGGLTLYLQDELFIKLKPTIVNLLFAGTLLGSLLLFNKPLLGLVFDSVIRLDEEGWRKLSLRWGLFFVFLAALNEVVWRFFSTDFWVSFKVFGVMPLTIAFALSQMKTMQRHSLDGPAQDAR